MSEPSSQQAMAYETFIYRSRIAAAAATVFQWHARPGAFERLTPPGEAVEIVERTGRVTHGARVVLRTRLGPWRLQWVAEHCDSIAGQQFRDLQRRGPFVRWEHTHLFIPDGPTACYLEDQILYVLPFGRCGRLGGSRLTRQKLARLFAYRHRVNAARYGPPCNL